MNSHLYNMLTLSRAWPALNGARLSADMALTTKFSVCLAPYTVYPKKYAHGFCFAVLCCGYTLTDFPISTRLTSLALWQSNDCPSASKATLMNMDKYFMWIHYERLHNHNKAKHNKTVCIFLGIYCSPDNKVFSLPSAIYRTLGIPINKHCLPLHSECSYIVKG